MTPSTIVIPVALQRYVDAPPVACRQRELARLLTISCGATLHFVSSEAPLHLAPTAETVAEKLNAFVDPLAQHGHDVRTHLLKGPPKEVVPPLVDELKADLVIIGSHAKKSPLEVPYGSNASSFLKQIDVEMVVVRPTHADVVRAREMMIPDYPWVFTYV